MTFLDEPAQGRDGILAVNEDPSNSEEPTERTSLLPSPAEHNTVSSDKARCTWLLEILASLGIPCILATEILLMLMDELGQLLADGYPPMRGTNTEFYAVYFVIGLMAVLIALPIVPFASQVHSSVTYVLALALIGTGIYNLVTFPFSATNPLKVFFQQSVNLTTGENRVQLATIAPFKSWYTHLPSARHVECAADNTRLGLINCAWSGRTPNVTLDDQPMAEWVTFSARKIGERKATFVIRGRNTRSCRIYSDTPIISLDVRGGHSLGQSRLNSTRQVHEVRLWSRTWDREFIVDLTWADGREHDKYTGRVACEWAEWDRGQIPALDEVKTFSPPWVGLTRLADGLVEGMHTFEL
ncbi:hypothetical protein FRC07_009057 [Ceratobasidium sp. 392]|nr:hypothetical protein FRC07_009057 [Ceratobasidium sp. 392]